MFDFISGRSEEDPAAPPPRGAEWQGLEAALAASAEEARRANEQDEAAAVRAVAEFTAREVGETSTAERV